MEYVLRSVSIYVHERVCVRVCAYECVCMCGNTCKGVCVHEYMCVGIARAWKYVSVYVCEHMHKRKWGVCVCVCSEHSGCPCCSIDPSCLQRKPEKISDILHSIHRGGTCGPERDRTHLVTKLVCGRGLIRKQNFLFHFSFHHATFPYSWLTSETPPPTGLVSHLPLPQLSVSWTLVMRHLHSGLETCLWS